MTVKMVTLWCFMCDRYMTATAQAAASHFECPFCGADALQIVEDRQDEAA